jgi:hypothetical protein
MHVSGDNEVESVKCVFRHDDIHARLHQLFVVQLHGVYRKMSEAEYPLRAALDQASALRLDVRAQSGSDVGLISSALPESGIGVLRVARQEERADFVRQHGDCRRFMYRGVLHIVGLLALELIVQERRQIAHASRCMKVVIASNDMLMVNDSIDPIECVAQCAHDLRLEIAASMGVIAASNEQMRTFPFYDVAHLLDHRLAD